MTVYPGINKSMKFSTLLPFLKKSVYDYIHKWIGVELYDELMTFYISSDTDEEMSNMLEQLRIAIAYYGIYLAFPSLNVTITDAGIMQSEGEKQRLAAQWGYKNARWQALYGAEKAIENILNIIQESTTEFPLTKSYAEGTDFINNIKDIADIWPVNSPRAYKSLFPFIRNAEDEVLKFLSYRTYDRLKDPGSEAYTTLEEKLLGHIKKFIVFRAVEMAMPAMLLYFDGQSATYITSADLSEPGYGVYNRHNVEMVEMYKNDAAKSSKVYKNEMKNFILANLEDFPEWKEDCYIEDRPSYIMHSEDGKGGIIL